MIKENEVFAQKKVGSEVWKDFGHLCNRESEEYCGYVGFNCCLKLLKHDRATSGTTHLKEHFQSCRKNKSSAAALVLQLPLVQAKLLRISTVKVSVCQKVLKKNY